MRAGLLRTRATTTTRAVVAAVGGLVLLGGCTTGALTQEAEAGDQKGYVAGDGSVTEVAAADRGEPVELSGQTTDGSTLSLADWSGDPVVLNTWFAACGPCRAEAPDLAEISADTAEDGVHFLGINVDDGAAQADAFAREFDIAYPSLLDADGRAVLALRGSLPPKGTPTTLVLDDQHRVAGRIVGRADPSTLRTLVGDVAAEDAGGAGSSAEGAATPAPTSG